MAFLFKVIMDKIQEAGGLAAWLMMEKMKPRNVAVIIAQNKYKLSLKSRSEISKIATKIKKNK